MPVVSNTSPILNLAIIGEIHLLREQFEEILIPEAVLEELRVEEDLPGSQAIRDAMKIGWIRTAAVEEDTLIRSMQRDLDRGEAEAIALAIQERTMLVLLDERDGRKIARLMGLEVVGILGVLLKAWHQGKLESLKRIMDSLRSGAGFYIRAVCISSSSKKKTRSSSRPAEPPAQERRGRSQFCDYVRDKEMAFDQILPFQKYG